MCIKWCRLNNLIIVYCVCSYTCIYRCVCDILGYFVLSIWWKKPLSPLPIVFVITVRQTSSPFSLFPLLFPSSSSLLLCNIARERLPCPPLQSLSWSSSAPPCWRAPIPITSKRCSPSTTVPAFHSLNLLSCWLCVASPVGDYLVTHLCCL